MKMHSETFDAKLTSYSNLLFNESGRYKSYATKWKKAGYISSAITVLLFCLLHLNSNWLVLFVPAILALYIRAYSHQNIANRIFDLLKSAHEINSEETLEAMHSYVKARYSKN